MPFAPPYEELPPANNHSAIKSESLPKKVEAWFIPQPVLDLKVLWARRTLLATLIIAILSIICEVWIMVNESTIKDKLLGDDGAGVSGTIWLNFKVELTYHSVFLTSLVFWFFVTWDGIMHQNIIQTSSVNVYNCGLLLYSVLQILQTENDLNTVRWAMTDQTTASDSGYFLAAQILLPSLISLFIPLYAFLTYKMFGEFGWRMYRITGGDKAVTRAFTSYHIFLLLIKFGAFFGAAFVVIDLVLTSISNTGRVVIAISSVVVGILAVNSGYYGVRNENSVLMILFLSCTLLIFGYVCERMVTAFSRGGDEFERAKIPFLLYGIACELLLISISFVGVNRLLGFGMGLKDVLDQEIKRFKGEYHAPVIDFDS